ncbi:MULTISPECIES: ABC transporter permease [unclassified Microbacterium]|uniref:ABC transporter permease n=1 Tax=unclassified Microbacterium TaxID=2609290 RepID=UPI000EAA8975|nr:MULTISPECIES: ABC transporter permease [unclassified Microbacterium]MBT2486301.1 ABC transporter permease [Microbacterium sp. ISL-108]RKN69014.1 ABC transporter permease [Microbacterium sp. CGR2]
MTTPDQLTLPADSQDALDFAKGTLRRPDAGERRARSRPTARIIGGLLLPALILLSWQIVTTSGLVEPYRLPTPASVFLAGVELAESGQLWTHIAISVQRVLLGFAIGSVIGLAAAGLVGLSRLGDILLSPTLAAVRAVPSLAWVPLLILWMQIGESSKVTLIAIGAFFPVYTTVASALRHVDPHLVEAGRSFSLHGWSLFRTVQLPAVVPSVVSGLRLALAQAWLFLVAAELIASSMGLGFLLTDSQSNGRVDRILLSIVLLALLGTVTNGILALVEKYLLRRWT